MRVYIFGPQGVGKTTISKYVADKYGFSQFSSSEIMMQICGVSSREELKNLDVKFKREREDRYYIPFLEDQGDILVDGHGVLNDEQVEFFDIFIYMSCSPGVLQERRKQDIKRKDREATIEAVNKDILEYSRKCNALEQQGALIHMIDNSDKIENAITNLEVLLLEFRKEQNSECSQEIALS